MQQQSETSAFGIDDARRVLSEVFAPWVQDLGLSVEAINHEPPEAAGDWHRNHQSELITGDGPTCPVHSGMELTFDRRKPGRHNCLVK